MRSQLLSLAAWVGPVAMTERVVAGVRWGMGMSKGAVGQVVRAVVFWGGLRGRGREKGVEREREGGVSGTQRMRGIRATLV